MKVVAAGIGVLVACLFLLAGFLAALPATLPMVEDGHLTLYQAVARSTTPPVDWRELLAVDAVRLKQDFSHVTRESVEATARLFVACHSESKSWDISLTFAAPGGDVEFDGRVGRSVLDPDQHDGAEWAGAGRSSGRAR